MKVGINNKMAEVINNYFGSITQIKTPIMRAMIIIIKEQEWEWEQNDSITRVKVVGLVMADM